MEIDRLSPVVEMKKKNKFRFDQDSEDDRGRTMIPLEKRPLCLDRKVSLKGN